MIRAPRSGFSPAIAFIFVTAVLDVMAMGIVIPVLPALVEEFTGSNASAGIYNGLFVTLWAGMQFVFSPIIGSLSDRFGRRPVILISAAGLAADFALMALAPNLWWLAAARILGGITSSSFTTVFAYMADITEPEKRARAYGLIGAAFSAGFVAGPLIGGVLGEFGPRIPFWAAAGLSSLAFLYGLFVLPESLSPDKRMAFSWRRANPFGALRLSSCSTRLIVTAGARWRSGCCWRWSADWTWWCRAFSSARRSKDGVIAGSWCSGSARARSELPAWGLRQPVGSSPWPCSPMPYGAWRCRRSSR
jgi:multidrug resistance protein